MKRPHLLRVEEEAECFAALLAAARREGLRVGWLDLVTPVAAPVELARPAAAGALRAVAAAPGCNIAVKPRRGAPVLLDLLREHFLGCALVLVRAARTIDPAAAAAGTEAGGPGEAGTEAGGPAAAGTGAGPAAPWLRPAGEGWRVEPVDSAVRQFSTAELVAALRRPRPWGA